jgi:cytidine deaminase
MVEIDRHDRPAERRTVAAGGDRLRDGRYIPACPEVRMMTIERLTDDDRALIEAATGVIAPQYKPGKTRTARTVGAALRTDGGSVYTGVNITADTPRASVCAEPVALGGAIANGETGFDAVAAVLYKPSNEPEFDGDDADPPETRIISACGVCREMLRDYDPDVDVIVQGAPHGFDEPVKRPVTELLPDVSWRGGTPPP